MGRHAIEAVETTIASAKSSVDALKELRDEIGSSQFSSDALEALDDLETKLLDAKSAAATMHDELADIETTNNLNSGGEPKE